MSTTLKPASAIPWSITSWSCGAHFDSVTRRARASVAFRPSFRTFPERTPVKTGPEKTQPTTGTFPRAPRGNGASSKPTTWETGTPRFWPIGPPRGRLRG